MESPLAIADIHAIVARPANRLLVANAAQPWLARCDERRVHRTDQAQGHVGGIDRDLRIKIDGFVFMQAEYVNVFHFDHGLG